MFAYADRDETLRTLYAWLNRCGIRATGMVPTSAVSVLLGSARASERPGASVMYYLDKHSSVISYAAPDGSLALVRSADIGYEALADAFRHLHEGTDAQGTLGEAPDEPDADSMLFEHGIPFQEKLVDGVELRARVLPRLAPALQRIGIDLKQTIRFGIPDASVIDQLVVHGPGAAIPMITKAIGEHLDFQVCAYSGSDRFDPSAPGSEGSTEFSFVQMKASVPMLLPRIASEEATRGRLKRAMVAGVALAGATMGGQYLHATHQIDVVQSRIAETEGRYEQIIAFDDERAEIRRVQQTLARIAAFVSQHEPVTPGWAVPLAALESLAGESIRVQDMSGESDAGSARLVISGYSVSSSGRSPEETLDQFVASLSGLEQVKSVQLGATNRIDLSASDSGGSEWGSQFSLSIEVGIIPSPYASFAAVETDDAWSQP